MGVEWPEELLNARVVFGLQPKDRERVTAMLAEGRPWSDIARVIGWQEATLREFYDRGNTVDSNGRTIEWTPELRRQWFDCCVLDGSASCYVPPDGGVCAEPLDDLAESALEVGSRRPPGTATIQQNCTSGGSDAE